MLALLILCLSEAQAGPGLGDVDFYAKERRPPRLDLPLLSKIVTSRKRKKNAIEVMSRLYQR